MIEAQVSHDKKYNDILLRLILYISLYIIYKTIYIVYLNLSSNLYPEVFIASIFIIVFWSLKFPRNPKI